MWSLGLIGRHTKLLRRETDQRFPSGCGRLSQVPVVEIGRMRLTARCGPLVWSSIRVALNERDLSDFDAELFGYQLAWS